MGWRLGSDRQNDRFIGYGVPAYCDHPGCNEEIHRGVAYMCGDYNISGDTGCGQYFCYEHLFMYEIDSDDNEENKVYQLCKRCVENFESLKKFPDWEKWKRPFMPSKEHPKWVRHLLTDPSWEEWRKENPKKVQSLKKIYAKRKKRWPSKLKKSRRVWLDVPR